ncbi:MAG: hypothetical protein BroJett021_36330 [Chloroflexota bacterium]|jgi:hypothetical protein|nr:hypothetical protein [Caldilinea sp.]GIK74645.1 MAG: hypothetical protein BroJett021_36330 [Chloroflexota bacterium]
MRRYWESIAIYNHIIDLQVGCSPFWKLWRFQEDRNGNLGTSKESQELCNESD